MTSRPCVSIQSRFVQLSHDEGISLAHTYSLKEAAGLVRNGYPSETLSSLSTHRHSGYFNIPSSAPNERRKPPFHVIFANPPFSLIREGVAPSVIAIPPAAVSAISNGFWRVPACSVVPPNSLNSSPLRA